MGLPENEVDLIFLTSPLHDVGEIGIPDSILHKPGKLDPEERAIMESHCTIGASILEEAPKGMGEFLPVPTENQLDMPERKRDLVREKATEIAMSHHEKWDGSGYPNKLSEDDIPISGQIVTIADVFDALRATRPYKRSFTFDKTMDLMRQGEGKHFAPKAFEAFENMAEEFERIRQNYSDG